MQLKVQSNAASQARLGVIIIAVPWSAPWGPLGSQHRLQKDATPRTEVSPASGQLPAAEERETHLQDGLRLGSVPVVCRESNM